MLAPSEGEPLRTFYKYLPDGGTRKEWLEESDE